MKIIVIMMQSHVIYAVILKKNRIYSAGYKSKKKTNKRSFQSLKSSAMFVVLRCNFPPLHKLPVPYQCIWRSMRGGNFNEK